MAERHLREALEKEPYQNSVLTVHRIACLLDKRDESVVVRRGDQLREVAKQVDAFDKTAAERLRTLASAKDKEPDAFSRGEFHAPVKHEPGTREKVIRLLWEKQFEGTLWANKFHMIRPDSLDADYGALADKIITTVRCDIEDCFELIDHRHNANSEDRIP